MNAIKSFNLGRLRDRSVLVWNLGIEDRAEKILCYKHPLGFLNPASRQGMENHTLWAACPETFCMGDSPRSESQLNRESEGKNICPDSPRVVEKTV